MALIRLDKYLADMGAGSRKDIKTLISSGRVSVDGRAVTAAEHRVDTGSSVVEVDGRLLSYVGFRYYMMDKPSGLVTATEDRRQPTVLGLLSPAQSRMGLFPVGRLDKDTSGLLLLTNDGDFAHSVISPKSEVEKLYYARVKGEVDEDDVKAFKSGLILADGARCLPAGLSPLGGDECLVTVMEGKYHQVKRMLASRGKPVTQLRRLAIGGLRLDESLGSGGIRELSQKEIDSVFMAT